MIRRSAEKQRFILQNKISPEHLNILDHHHLIGLLSENCVLGEQKITFDVIMLERENVVRIISIIMNSKDSPEMLATYFSTFLKSDTLEFIYGASLMDK